MTLRRPAHSGQSCNTWWWSERTPTEVFARLAGGSREAAEQCFWPTAHSPHGHQTGLTAIKLGLRQRSTEIGIRRPQAGAPKTPRKGGKLRNLSLRDRSTSRYPGKFRTFIHNLDMAWRDQVPNLEALYERGYSDRGSSHGCAWPEAARHSAVDTICNWDRSGRRQTCREHTPAGTAGVDRIPHPTNSSMMGVDFLPRHGPLLLLAVS